MLSQDSENDCELAFQIWKSLQQFIPISEVEKHQRRTDLSHVLSVFIRDSDWSSCDRFLHEPNCDVSHVALVLRGIARSDTNDVNHLSSMYMDHHDKIYQSVDASTMKDVLYVIGLMLDVCSLCDGLALLSMVVNDVLTALESGSSQIDIPNKLYSRLVRLSVEKNLTDCVYGLYLFQNEKYHSMTRIYRLMERYMRGVNASDEVTSQMKQTVLSLHYSNPTDEESLDDPDLDEEFVEPSVLEVLKGFNLNKNQVRSRNSPRSQHHSQNHTRYSHDRDQSKENYPHSKIRSQGNSQSKDHRHDSVRSQGHSYNHDRVQDLFQHRSKSDHSPNQFRRNPKGNSLKESMSEERNPSSYRSQDHYHKGFK